jgi:L,D-peptidoglycan transpeptidase YkuD (ErfK/YbiS/YcfS/YnhG family)
MKPGFLTALAVFAFGTAAAAQDRGELPAGAGAWRPQQEIPELREARQLILVVTPAWESVRAELARFERDPAGGSWRAVSKPIPTVVGRNGLAWGIGFHSPEPPGLRTKQEGDGKAPAGAFALVEVFGYATAAEAGIRKFPYRALTPATEGVDDPKSRFYNRIVERAPGAPKDWDSAEQMRRDDELYRWGVVVGHNLKPFAGAGSCIFLHLWEAPDKGTAGCTAMTAERMEELVRWLDEAKKPVLVQLPREEYERLKLPWALP